MEHRRVTNVVVQVSERVWLGVGMTPSLGVPRHRRHSPRSLDFTSFPPSALPNDRQTRCKGLLPLVLQETGRDYSLPSQLFCYAVITFHLVLSFLFSSHVHCLSWAVCGRRRPEKLAGLKGNSMYLESKLGTRGCVDTSSDKDWFFCCIFSGSRDPERLPTLLLHATLSAHPTLLCVLWPAICWKGRRTGPPHFGPFLPLEIWYSSTHHTALSTLLALGLFCSPGFARSLPL